MRIPRKGTERRQEVEMLCTDMLVSQGASFAENRCDAGLLFDSLCKEIANLNDFSGRCYLFEPVFRALGLLACGKEMCELRSVQPVVRVGIGEGNAVFLGVLGRAGAAADGQLKVRAFFERILADFGHAVRNGQAAQRAASVESAFADGGQAVGKLDVGQCAAEGESLVFDGGQALLERNVRHVAAGVERPCPDD